MRIRIVTIGMLLLVAGAIMTAGQNGNDLYQQGLARETAGDLKGAVQIFERIVRDFSSNRTLTARTLLQLGRWSDLLGEDQARRHYERVIREFADQKEAAAEARVRLDVLARVAAPGASPAGRLVVDWLEWDRKSGGTRGKPTRDGRHLLRYNEKERAFELVEIGTGDVRRLTADGPNPAEVVVEGRSSAVQGAELSTDGRRLAAMVELRKPRPAAGPKAEFERAELRVFEVGGRGPGRVLATWDAQALSIQPFAWAPRDDRVWLFVMRSDQSAQIASVDMSGKLQVLKTLTWRDHSQPPSLSPDGRFLAYHDATSRQSPPDLYIIATDGSREQRVEHPADDSKPMFLPDGSGVVFASDRRGARDLWFLAVKDGRPADQLRLVWRNVGPIGVAEGFTDTGSLFFYFAVNDVGVYTVPLDLNAAAGSIGEPTRLAPLVNEMNSGAAFSPDGRYLAHFRANAARIVIRELATGLEREIPFGAQLGYATADWCSSADTLIATANIRGTGWVGYRVNVRDTSVERLPIALPALSPFFPVLCVGDGEEIIYVPTSYPPGVPTAAPPSIIRRSLASGRETTLFKGAVEALARSMDGNRLAFVTVDPNADVARLVTMPAAGGDVSADVMTSGTYQYQGGRAPLIRDVVWMPSGDRLLVARANEGESVTNRTQRLMLSDLLSLWEVPLTGAAPRKLGLLPLPKVELAFPGPTSLTVHPDGKRLAFQSREGFVQQTWAIDNLFQFIKAGGGW